MTTPARPCSLCSSYRLVTLPPFAGRSACFALGWTLPDQSCRLWTPSPATATNALEEGAQRVLVKSAAKSQFETETV